MVGRTVVTALSKVRESVQEQEEKLEKEKQVNTSKSQHAGLLLKFRRIAWHNMVTRLTNK